MRYKVTIVCEVLAYTDGPLGIRHMEIVSLPNKDHRYRSMCQNLAYPHITKVEEIREESEVNDAKRL